MIKDLKGNKYNNLTVITADDKRASNGSVMWLCKCDCGNICYRTKADLNLQSKSCGCHKHKISIGMKFGKLTVKEYVGRREKDNRMLWKCECECGKFKIVASINLLNIISGVRSCGCARSISKKKPKGEATFNAAYHNLVNAAKRKQFTFNLTKQEVKEIHKQNCYYCGDTPKNLYISNCDNGDYIYSGIDRVDSNKGYILGNVVPCCKRCNTAKNDMSVEEFENWLKRVYENYIERNMK